MRTKADPVVEPGLDLVTYLRREREVTAKARAGNATIEDYMSLGYTEAGARWMVEAEPELPESWLDEWYLWHRGKAAPGPLAEVDFPPFRPFSIGDRATAYEWMMVWGDREPYAPWFRLAGVDDSDDPNPMPKRGALLSLAKRQDGHLQCFHASETQVLGSSIEAAEPSGQRRASRLEKSAKPSFRAAGPRTVLIDPLDVHPFKGDGAACVVKEVGDRAVDRD